MNANSPILTLATRSVTRPVPHKSSHLSSRLYRFARYRLVIPMLRARHGPEYAARGTMIGLVLAFTPTTGLHVPLIFALWLVAKKLLKWEFSVIVAFAWIWLSNVFTVLPSYYLFYVTGQLMLGRFGDSPGYAQFTELWRKLEAGDHAFWQEIVLMAKAMLQDWGLPMAIGSIPWAALAGGLGYWLSLNFVRAYRKKRTERRLHRKTTSPLIRRAK